MGFAVGKPLLPLLGGGAACALEAQTWLSRNVGSSPTHQSHVVRAGVRETASSEKGSSQPFSLI